MGQIKNKEVLRKIALRVKHIRSSQNVTLEQFYFDTGIHLARIESGRSNISVSTLYEICKYFNLTLAEFFKDLT